MRRSDVLLSALLLAGAGRSLAAWPEIAMPDGARIESIGEQVRLNGVPMRMHRVLSSQSPKELIGFYRDALGSRRAEQPLPDGLVLAQERGDYFVTVRIKALSSGSTEVLVSASDMVEAKRSATRPPDMNFPADSLVLSDMESVDSAKHSRQLVVRNGHSVAANVRHLLQSLEARGYHPDAIPGKHTGTEYVQFFKGEQREALLTLTRKDSLTQIVLTTIFNP